MLKVPENLEKMYEWFKTTPSPSAFQGSIGLNPFPCLHHNLPNPPQSHTNTRSQPHHYTPTPHHNTFPPFSLCPCLYSPNTYTPTYTSQTPCPSSSYPIQYTHASTLPTHAPVQYTACPYSHAVITEN